MTKTAPYLKRNDVTKWKKAIRITYCFTSVVNLQIVILLSEPAQPAIFQGGTPQHGES